MPPAPNSKFITNQVDLSRVKKVSPIETNWTVLTGAPCSGKTTLIDLLAERGCQAIEETGRIYIDSQLAKGCTLAELRSDESVFQRSLLDVRLSVEDGLPTDQPVGPRSGPAGFPQLLPCKWT